jgi:basic membrane lipoprotein Med (substrate-binding protein (PBP1-ABC) superfamily)
MKEHQRFNKKSTIFVALVLAAGLFLSLSGLTGCSKKEAPGSDEPYAIAVFIPGVVAGSPIYEMLVAGAERAAAEYDRASIKVVEGGFNQAEWAEKMTALAASGDYALILTSNPAMPFVCREVAESFPEQKFLNLDAYLADHPQIHTVLYNQVEQAYLVGYLGGLVTTSSLPGATPELKVGLIAAQQYPALDKMMRPGFLQGLKAVDEDIEVDFRVIGNWYDAGKAADLAHSMFDAGVDIILTIAGGANQGVINAARERGKYVLYFDANGYAIAPGTILGCAVLHQDKLTYERVKMAVEGGLEFGSAQVVHARQGYVDFVDDDPLYREHVPEELRTRMDALVAKMRRGEFSLEVPSF